MRGQPRSERGAPIVAVIESAAELFAEHPGVAQLAAERLRRALADAPLTIVATLDRALRDGGLHRALRRDFVDVTPDELGRLDRLAPDDRRLALIVASCLRGGYVRAAAVQRLAIGFDAWIAAALIVRLTDYVPAIREDAARALRARLRPAAAADLVRALPLVDRLARWSRASPVLAELRDLLSQPSPLCERALWAGARSGEPGLVLACCRLLARRFAGEAALAEVYALALADRSPVTRRFVAEAIADPRATPPPLRRRFLQALADDRSPAIRRLAVRLWAREADGNGPLIAAAFDGNADVRHHARRYLARRGEAIDYRGRALATLAAPSSTAALIGALATLSDFGRSDDLPRIEPLGDDPRPRVAREASRTCGLLGALTPGVRRP